MDLDEEVSSSLRELADDGSPLPAAAGGGKEKALPDNGRALLGNSLSSDFFKNVKKTADKRSVSSAHHATSRIFDVLINCLIVVIDFDRMRMRRPLLFFPRPTPRTMRMSSQRVML